MKIQIHCDERSPYSGTDYPIGTIEHPVNNLSDALKIAEKYIKNYKQKQRRKKLKKLWKKK